MAIITALVTATRVLASQGVKKAAVSGAKGLAKRKVKNFVTGKGKKKTKPGVSQRKGKGESRYTSAPGAIVRTGSSAVTPLVEGVSKTTQQSSSGESSGGGSVSEQLTRILGLTKTIDGIVKTQYSNQKKNAQKARVSAEKEKKREREESLESKGGLGLGGIGAAIGKAGEKFGIWNFFKNILLGGLLVGLLKNWDKINLAFTQLGEGIEGTLGGLKLFALTFVNAKPAIIKGFKNLKGFVSKAGSKVKGGFLRIGKAIKGLFSKVGNYLKKFIPNIIKRSVNAARAAGRAAQEGARRAPRALSRLFGLDTRSNKLGASKGGLNKLIGGGKGAGSIGLTRNVKRIRAKHGDEAARMFQGLIDNGMDPERAQRYVNKQIDSKKLTSRPMKGSAGGGIGGSQLVKGGLKQTSKRALIKFVGKGGAKVVLKTLSRIPIIGPLIVGVVSYLETGKMDQALFRAGGALLGGFLGSFIPIPVLGTLMGELVGEYVGDLFYTLIKGGGPEALGKRLEEDLKSILSTGKKAVEWVGNGISKFYKGIPKVQFPDLSEFEVKIPFTNFTKKINLNPFVYGPLNSLIKNTTGTGIQDLAFPNPIWWMNPLNIGEKVSLIQKSFFNGGEVKEGKVAKDDSSKSVTLKGQSKQISEDAMYLQEGVGYFDSKTQRFLGKSKKQAEATYRERQGDDAIPETEDHSEGEGLGGSVTTNFDFDPGKGDKSRRIFLHWSAGPHSKAFPAYHTTFLGSGKAVRGTPYGQDKGSHTAGANTNSVGLSVAAMGGAGVDENNFGSYAPTVAQLDAMTTEAAQLAYAWGWDAATVEKNVRTHGEWERYATQNGILPGDPQRWDLDKLKQSDPDIDTSKVLSSGGSKLRSMIKSKLAKLKSGKSSKKVDKSETQKAPKPAQTSSTSTTEDQIKDVSASEAKVDGATSSQTKKEESKKPVVMKRHWNETRIGKNKTQGGSGEMTSPDTFPPAPVLPSPAEISAQQSSPGASTSGIEREASYDLPEEGSTSFVPFVIPMQQGGESSSGSLGSSGSSKSSVLNSYHKQQILGSLFKQG